MKPYELEFSFFNKINWKNETVTITTTSKISAIKEFIRYTCYSEPFCQFDRKYFKEVFKSASIDEIELPRIVAK